MGCCGSKEEEPIQAVESDAVTELAQEAEGGEAAALATNRVNLQIEESSALRPKAFLASVLKAREECSGDAAILTDCIKRLKAYNARLKEYVAVYDCQTVNEAMNGGFMGLGCNDKKLIAAICTRTKAQLERTRKQYRTMYDKDMRAEVKSETGGSYQDLMFFALAGRAEYIADIIDMACNAGVLELGCDETALLEVFVTRSQSELQDGKKKWEGRTDKSLVDYLNSELGSSYRHLNALLQKLYMGDRAEADAKVDDSAIQDQVDEMKIEIDKGWFEDFDESAIISIIGGNTTAQNVRLAQLYEKSHGESLAKALKSKCGDRMHYALNALLLPKSDFLAMRLHDAMKGWGTDKKILTRLLGGLDGEAMKGVTVAYEEKYDRPLWSMLKEEISGDFLTAALTWLKSLDDPTNGAEGHTEVELESLGNDPAKLCELLDHLLMENDAVLGAVARLDVECLREACQGSGTEDTAFIRTMATRSKRSLARVNKIYRDVYGETLQALIQRELLVEGSSRKNEWYAFLAKFLVVQEEQADTMILDIAMGGQAVDHAALVEFLCARHPKRVRAAKEKYEQQKDDSLVDKLADSTAGDMQKLALRLLKGKRDVDERVDDNLAKKQAHQLKDKTVDFIETLCDNGPKQNAAVGRHYEDAYDESLRRAISNEYSGPVKNALLALAQGPSDWYAAQLKAALAGDEVDHARVCRIVGAHDKDEIVEIAQAYEKKYGVTLKAAITSQCKGNYKRLAVAWVDLADQLAQPESKIDVPSKEEVPERASSKKGGAGKAVDDEISDEDDAAPTDPDPSSGMYQAKLTLWRTKYEKYEKLGKKHKAEHYQELLIFNPPLPKGHKVLEGYVEALAEEYKGGKAASTDWTMMWFESVGEGDFKGAAISKDGFKAWLDITETMVAQKKVSVTELKGHWGIKKGSGKPKPAPRQQSGQPPPPQQMMLPPPGQPNVVNIQVPMGVYPGQLFTFRMPDGSVANLQVPPGAGPGCIIPVQCPPPRPMAQAPPMPLVPPQPGMVLVDLNGDGIPDEWRMPPPQMQVMQVPPAAPMRNEMPPPPAKGDAQGFQNDGHGPLWCGIAHTEVGGVPCKVDEAAGMAWYPLGGREHQTDQFSIVRQMHKAQPGTAHGFNPQGFQTDGAGYMWCAVARTPWGRIPGKAQGTTCWFSYGGQEHSTGDFYYIGKRGGKGQDPEVMEYALHGMPQAARKPPPPPDDYEEPSGAVVALGFGLLIGVCVVGAIAASNDREERERAFREREEAEAQRRRKNEQMLREREARHARMDEAAAAAAMASIAAERARLEEEEARERAWMDQEREMHEREMAREEAWMDREREMNEMEMENEREEMRLEMERERLEFERELMEERERMREEMEAEAEARREADEALLAAEEEERLAAQEAAAAAMQEEEADYDDDGEDYDDEEEIVEMDPEGEALEMYGSAGPTDLDDGGRGPGDAYRTPAGPIAIVDAAPVEYLVQSKAGEMLGAMASVVKSILVDEPAPSLAAQLSMMKLSASATTPAAAPPSVSEVSAEDDDVALESPLPTWLVKQPAAICAPPSKDGVAAGAVTLVTQCSVDRLPRLATQLRSWKGAASVAVFAHAAAGSVAAVEAEEAVRAILATLPSAVVRCTTISFGFLPAETEETSCTTFPYPINALRNLALANARTELVMLLDVDFVVSPNLSTALAAGADGLRNTLTSTRTALVVPAFEVSPDAALPTGRRALEGLLDSKQASLFHVGHFPKGHSATDLRQWRSASAPYKVSYEEYYEPYVIVSRRWCPAYDERFVGYGLNKVSHLYQLAAEGCGFVVLPEHFVCAHEHAKSAEWHAIFGKSADPRNKPQLASLYKTFKASLPALPEEKSDDHKALVEAARVLDVRAAASAQQLKAPPADEADAPTTCAAFCRRAGGAAVVTECCAPAPPSATADAIAPAMPTMLRV